MSLRADARSFAEKAVRDAASGIVGDTLAAIERRLQWRWNNAPLLAKEAERMVWLLERASPVRFRRIRVAYWRARHRRFSAKAWAQDPAFAEACRICREVP